MSKTIIQNSLQNGGSENYSGAQEMAKEISLKTTPKTMPETAKEALKETAKEMSIDWLNPSLRYTNYQDSNLSQFLESKDVNATTTHPYIIDLEYIKLMISHLQTLENKALERANLDSGLPDAKKRDVLDSQNAAQEHIQNIDGEMNIIGLNEEEGGSQKSHSLCSRRVNHDMNHGAPHGTRYDRRFDQENADLRSRISTLETQMSFISAMIAAKEHKEYIDNLHFIINNPDLYNYYDGFTKMLQKYMIGAYAKNSYLVSNTYINYLSGIGSMVPGAGVITSPLDAGIFLARAYHDASRVNTVVRSAHDFEVFTSQIIPKLAMALALNPSKIEEIEGLTGQRNIMNQFLHSLTLTEDSNAQFNLGASDAKKILHSFERGRLKVVNLDVEDAVVAMANVILPRITVSGDITRGESDCNTCASNSKAKGCLLSWNCCIGKSSTLDAVNLAAHNQIAIPSVIPLATPSVMALVTPSVMPLEINMSGVEEVDVGYSDLT